jgi:hypothetical protein
MKRTISSDGSEVAARLRAVVGPTPASGDPFAALGIQPTADWAEVRQAYLRRARMFPPEHFPVEFLATQEAYNALKAAAVAAQGVGSGAKRRRCEDPCLDPAGAAKPPSLIVLDERGVAHEEAGDGDVGSDVGSDRPRAMSFG